MKDGLELRTRIGSGSYGEVWRAREKNGNDVAVKFITTPSTLNVIEGAALVNEIRALREMDNEHVLHLLRIFKHSSGRIAIVTPVFDFTLAAVTRYISATQRRHIIYQLLCALHYVHWCGWVHCDVKPANILINADCFVVLADLGMIRKANTEIVSDEDAYIVTRWYRPPEIAFKCRTGITPAVDIWSLACVWMQLVCGGEPPFKPDQTFVLTSTLWTVFGLPKAVWCYATLQHEAKSAQFETWVQSKYEACTECSSRSLQDADDLDVICKMMRFDYCERPSASKILADVYGVKLAAVNIPERLEPTCHHKWKIDLEKELALPTLDLMTCSDTEDDNSGGCQ
jgi:serine/threonine protein kinase